MKHGIASDEMFDIMEPHPKYVTKIQMKRIKTWKPSRVIGNIQTTQSLSQEFVDKMMAQIPEEPLAFDPARTCGIAWRLRWCECLSLGGVEKTEAKLSPSPPTAPAESSAGTAPDVGVPTLETWHRK